MRPRLPCTMKKFLVGLVVIVGCVLAVWAIWSMNDWWLNVSCALLPTLGLILYVVLDHLSTGNPNETLSRRLIASVKFWNSKSEGDLESKSQLAVGLIVIMLASGGAQFRKARRDAAASVSMQSQLTSATSQLASANSQLDTANSIASASLIAATNSENDIRILQANLESKMEGDRRIFLAMSTNCPASPFLSVVADEFRRPLVVTNGSSKLKSWAENAARTLELKTIEDTTARETARAEALHREFQAGKADYDLFDRTIKFLYETLLSEFARKGYAVTPISPRLPPLESIIASNYHCHLTTLCVGTPSPLLYDCETGRNSGDPPVLYIRCQLTNETVTVWVERWGDANIRSGLSCIRRLCACPRDLGRNFKRSLSRECIA